jgi:hypothetical protein
MSLSPSLGWDAQISLSATGWLDNSYLRRDYVLVF